MQMTYKCMQKDKQMINVNNIYYKTSITNDWLKMNELNLNESKTKLLQINMNDDSVIKINNETTEKDCKIKYIELIIDKDFKHIDYIHMQKISFLKTN